MEWPQVLTIAGANIVILVGMLGTIITLHLNSDKKITAIQDEMKDFHRKYMDETRDFHGRLVAIEERRVRILEK